MSLTRRIVTRASLRTPQLLTPCPRRLQIQRSTKSFRFPLFLRLNTTLTKMTNHEPEGDAVSTTPSVSPDASSPSMIINGDYISIRPLQLTDAPALYHSLCGSGSESLWKYLPEGPFSDLESFSKHMSYLCQRAPFFPFVLLSKNPSQIPPPLEYEVKEEGEGIPVGLTTLMSDAPAHHRIEIGHVVYSTLLQRSPASTEATYLLLKLCFENLGYTRVEWKCNDKNQPSMKAAERLGFVYEGTFRRHMVVKGRRRDTAWYSVVNEDWMLVKKALEPWLRRDNFEGGGQKERLEVLRESIRRKRAE